jgi:hypothetical protein
LDDEDAAPNGFEEGLGSRLQVAWNIFSGEIFFEKDPPVVGVLIHVAKLQRRPCLGATGLLGFSCGELVGPPFSYSGQASMISAIKPGAGKLVLGATNS